MMTKALKFIAYTLCFFALPALVALPPAQSYAPADPIAETVRPSAPPVITLPSLADLLDLIDDIEGGDFEEHCNAWDLLRAAHLLTVLARSGLSTADHEQRQTLADDASHLLGEAYAALQWEWNPRGYQLVPAVHHPTASDALFVPAGFFGRSLRSLGRFVKKHKKAIIIGAAVVVAATVVVGVVSISSAAAIASSATAVAGCPDALADASAPDESPPPWQCRSRHWNPTIPPGSASN